MIKKIRKGITFILLITVFITMLPIKSVFAKADDNINVPDGEYVITSKLSNKSIEVANYGKNIGDLIQQWTYGGALQQQWILQKVTNEYFKIVSKISSKVIEVKDSDTYDGSIIQQNDYLGTDNQLWYFEKDSNGYFEIKSKQSKKCLDIKDYCRDDGAKLQLYTDNDGDNQKWKLTKINNNITSGNKYIFKSKRADKLLQVTSNSKENGACIEQWDYNSDNSQVWILSEVEDGYYSIVSDDSGKVIDVRNTDTENGTTIYQWDYNGQDNQLWYFEEDSDGYCKIKSKQSGKCLDVEEISSDNGAKIQLWSDVDGDNQKWKVISLEKDSDDDGLINSKEIELGTDIFKFDTDNDELYDYEELQNNTNPLLSDTDSDGLTDGFEVNYTFTDPLNKYSKDKNVSDDLLDLDNDKLNNIEEQSMKLNPLGDDSDFDGISDYDEINKYKTSPVKYDTDGDELGDGTEIKEGFNPLKQDSDDNGIIDSKEKITASLQDKKYDSLDENKLGYMPEIEITGEGDYNSKLSIIDVSKINNEMPDLDYIVGVPIKIEHDDDLKFDNAEISFNLTDELLKNEDINNLAIAYYDEENKILQPLNTQVDLENKILTVNTNHFSYYCLININKWQNENFIDSSSSEINVGMCDVVFVLDTTGSMGVKINNLKNNIISFAKQMEDNKIDARFGLVEFRDISCSEKTIDHGFFYNSVDLKNELSKISASGGGDIDESAVDGLETARRMNFRNNAIKHFVLLTDAGYKNETSYDGIKSMQQVVDSLRVDETTVSVISAGSYKSTYKLLYEGTEGEFLNINSDFSTSLLSITKNISNKSSAYTWIRLSDGTVVKINVDPSKAEKDDTTDTDGDGVPDVKELINKTEKEFNGYKYVVWNFKSNPAIADWITDKDGNLIIAPLYSEKYIDSDNTFSANEMSSAISDLSAYVVYKFSNECKDNIKPKDRTRIINNIVLYYLQQGKYDNILWKILDSESLETYSITKLIDYNTDKFKKYRMCHLIDPKTGKDIDFTHLAASLNGHYINEDTFNGFPIELSSWGGDLQTLLAEIAIKVNGSSNETYIKNVCKQMLGSEETSFSESDMLADIDAINISNKLKGGNNSLYKIFFSYYESGECYKRYTLFSNYYKNIGFDKKLNSILPIDNIYSMKLPIDIKSSYVALYYLEMINIHKKLNRTISKESWATLLSIQILKAVFKEYINEEVLKE